jgi:predicted unusual protein kinase regulating ubiquinone biosynthesis (AarF/ABC1/UbiB family)
VATIVPALAGFFDTVLDKSVSELNFKSIVDGLGAVLYEFPFNVPAYYALILRSLSVLEGLALYSDPNYKVSRSGERSETRNLQRCLCLSADDAMETGASQAPES